MEFISDHVSYITLKGRWCDFLGMPNSSIFAHEELLYHTYKNFCKNQGPELHKFSKVLNQIHISLVIRENRMIQPKLNEIFGTLVESGISDKFRREITMPRQKQSFRDLIDFVPFSLEHLQSPLILYSIGIGISFMTFGFELLISKIKK